MVLHVTVMCTAAYKKLLRLAPIFFTLMVCTLWQGSVHALSEGEMAKDFTLPTPTGENLRLKEMRGKVVLLNFWASWCPPCRKELPLLDEIHKKYESLGFAVVGVNTDNDRSKVEKVLSQIPVSFPVALDAKNEVVSDYEVEAMPSTYMIDRTGKVRTVHLGYKDGYEKLYEEEVKKLIKE